MAIAQAQERSSRDGCYQNATVRSLGEPRGGRPRQGCGALGSPAPVLSLTGASPLSQRTANGTGTRRRPARRSSPRCSSRPSATGRRSSGAWSGLAGGSAPSTSALTWPPGRGGCSDAHGSQQNAGARKGRERRGLVAAAQFSGPLPPSPQPPQIPLGPQPVPGQRAEESLFALQREPHPGELSVPACGGWGEQGEAEEWERLISCEGGVDGGGLMVGLRGCSAECCMEAKPSSPCL